MTLNAFLVQTTVCDKSYTGSIVISDDTYSGGEFEFKIVPNMNNGLVTVVGLADDGISPQKNFI